MSHSLLEYSHWCRRKRVLFDDKCQSYLSIAHICIATCSVYLYQSNAFRRGHICFDNIMSFQLVRYFNLIRKFNFPIYNSSVTNAKAVVRMLMYVGIRSRSQTTVENCIGGHVNVLSDYKKT